VAGQERAGRELERAAVAQAARGVGRALEELLDAASWRHDDERVALVRRRPDVAGAIERDAVGALERRMRREHGVEAQRVGRVGRVAAGPGADAALAVEAHPPDRPAGGVGDQHRAVAGERDPVGDDRLGGAGRHAAILATDPRAVEHRRDAQDLGGGAALRRDPPDAAQGGPAVRRPQRAAAVEGDAVGARDAGGERRRRRSGARCGRRRRRR